MARKKKSKIKQSETIGNCMTGGIVYIGGVKVPKKAIKQMKGKRPDKR